ncbi:ubiquitin-related modifier 1 [Lipomyces kononenkoae]|uniref:Ubiquitin-related modifier 1 n=1 Tax=Lipomyces kononenkoae TaxID=34357 RepID=A0ACC3T6J8_LIPKO
MAVPLTVEFSGGLEALFNNERSINLSLESRDGSENSPTITDLVVYLCEKVMMDKRRELFVIDGYHVRPGVLVLINDADWELVGEENYVIQPGDEILFASTLHGG